MIQRLLILCVSMIALVSCGGGTANKTVSAADGQIVPLDVSLEEAMKMIKDKPDMVILDVRTPTETSEGMIPNAIEIDYKGADFKEKIAKLDKSKDYLVYCRSGNRSGKSCKIMSELGFKSYRNLAGGYMGYKEKY